MRELARLLADLETRHRSRRAREYGDVGARVGAAQQDTVAAEKSLLDSRESARGGGGELARLESRHDMAARIASELEGFRAGAAALLRDPERQGRLRGAMAERMKVQEGYESAFELVFGEDSDALLVEDVRSAREFSDHLAARGSAWRVSSRRCPMRIAWRCRPTASPVVRRWTSSGSTHPRRPSCKRWLERVRVVETNDEAVDAIIEHAGQGWSFLSREGLFLRHDGLVRGGAGARRELSLFGRQEQVDQLANEVRQRRTFSISDRPNRTRSVRALEASRDRVEQLRHELDCGAGERRHARARSGWPQHGSRAGAASARGAHRGADAYPFRDHRAAREGRRAARGPRPPRRRPGGLTQTGR